MRGLGGGGWLVRASLAVLAVAVVAGAQAPRRPGAGPPAEIVLQPQYRAGASYAWRIHIHSVLRRTQNGEEAGATLDNRATVILRILSAPAAPNPAAPVLAEARFSAYQTRVSGFGGWAEALRASASATDRAVGRMHPVELRLTPGAAAEAAHLGAPPAPAQALTVLRQLFSTAGLPLGAVRAGDHWRRQEVQNLPQSDDSFPLNVRAAFTGWRRTPDGRGAEGNWRAEVNSHSQASVGLPPGAIPGFAAAALAGLASQARLQIDGQTTSEYGTDGILDHAKSHTRTWLRITRQGALAGGSAAMPNGGASSGLQVDSTGTVERVTRGAKAQPANGL